MFRINEFAESRRDIISDMESDRSNIIEHVCKIYMNPKDSALNHWLTELATWLVASDRYILKSNNKRPKKDMYLNHLLREVETYNDAYSKLVKASVSYEDPDDAKCKDFVKRWSSLRQELAKMLSDEKNYNRSDYQSIVKKYML